MSDLIEQLRKERSTDVQDAADRLEEQELLIEAQQAEIAQLRAACKAVAASAMRNEAYDLCVAAIAKAKGE